MTKITLSAVGDISFAGQVEKDIVEHGPTYPFEKVMPELKKADILFGNLESVMVTEDFPLSEASGHPLQSRDSALEALRPVGFDILQAASNHVLDCGWKGLLHTYNCLRSIGVQSLGTGPSQKEARMLRTVEKNGVKIGFLGYLQAGDWTLEGGGKRIAYLKLKDMLSDIRKHRAKVDVLVISIHGDIEFQPAPSIPRLKLCRAIAEAGADLILCHHPHVPQGVERWDNCLINYSLANFIFQLDGYLINSSQNVNRSHIFSVDIEDGKITDWHRKYLKINMSECRPYTLSPAEEKEEDKYYKWLDSILKSPEKLTELWHENCLKRLAKIMDGVRGNASLSPELFLKKYGRQLFSDMCHEYLDGLYEMAYNDYQKNAHNDFEFKRPYAPYEQ